LRVEMLGRERLFFAQFQHLFDRSNLFCHDNRELPRLSRSKLGQRHIN
jgi:hypothetical protein